jgi:hypothetical protein
VVDRTYTSFYTPCQQARLSATGPTTTKTPAINSVCPTSHVVVRNWVVADNELATATQIKQRIYFYSSPTVITPALCVLIDSENYPSLGFTFGSLSDTPDLQLANTLINPESCRDGTRKVFASCTDVAGGPPSAVCIYDEDTDELYFAEKPQVNLMYI